LADDAPVIVFGKGCWFVLAKWKNRASALGVDWTCSPRNARYFLVETLLYKILIHQDCYRQFRDQENGTRND
jgi:uroporphyrinogen-III decarboxylase